MYIIALSAFDIFFFGTAFLIALIIVMCVRIYQLFRIVDKMQAQVNHLENKLLQQKQAYTYNSPT